jgi:predicted thioesterase
LELDLKLGIQGEKTEIVSESNTAIQYGSGNLPVYATPAMVGLMEGAAAASVEPKLLEGMSTVGISLTIQHLAATPLGMNVRAVSELIDVNGKKLRFNVTAFDEKEKIGEGTHERFIVSADKFLQKAQAKSKP